MKKHKSFLLLLVALGLFLSTSAFKQDLQQSHVKSTKPDTPEEFQRLLARDLTAYFEQKIGPGISVHPELLSRAPAQAGEAHPQFYAWVTVKKADTILDAGAVKGAVLNNKSLKVTEYLPRTIIQNVPKSPEALFPSSLWDDIRARAKAER
jgi:hypothetical protein